MRRKCIWLLAGLGCLVATAPANAQWYKDKWELTPFVGYETTGGYPLTPTSTTINVTNARANGGVSFGTFVDYSLSENFQAEFMWDRNPTSYSELVVPSPSYVKAYNSDIDQYQFGLLYMFLGREHKWRPYVAGGVGFTHEFNSALASSPVGTTTPNRTDVSFGIGGGVKYKVTDHIAFRGDARFMPTYANSSVQTFCDPFYGCYPANASNYQHRGNFLAGVVFSF
jgi:opacity protein-like surface antigen